MAKKHFIRDAIRRPGALRRKAGVSGDDTIPVSKLTSMERTARREGDTRTLRQIALARTLGRLRKKRS